MIRAIPLLLVTACGPRADLPRYDNTLLQLASGYAAKMMCSCLWVAERDEAACAAWSRARPDIARYQIDAEAQTVTARALGAGRTTARYLDGDRGCAIVED